jgi:hypothetical protein
LPELSSALATAPFATVWALVTLGHAESKLGATNDAPSRFGEAFSTLGEVSHPGFLLAICLEGIAAGMCATGDLERAARLFGAADCHWQTIRASRRMFVEQRDDDARAAEAQLGEAAFRSAWNEGRVMDVDGAVALALDCVRVAARTAHAGCQPVNSSC